MPVQATPTQAVEGMSSDSVRIFLRDYTGKNPLLDDVEFSDEEIKNAMNFATDQANVIARPTSFSASSFPNKYVLLIGTCAFLMKSEAFRQIRNQATYQDGNIQPVGIDDKQSFYSALGQNLSAEFTQLVTTIKISENMSTFGRLKSPILQAKPR